MANSPSLLEMLKAGVHFGHRTSRWHPKMAPFIFGSRAGVHIIDVEKTQVMLEKTISYVEDLIARGGMVMFVGTKKQATDLVEKVARDAGAPYVNTRWLGGTFTNFAEIQRLITNYLDLKDKREKGELKKYTKLEQLQFDRRIAELEGKIGGISSITKLPEAMFVLDVRHDKTAVTEARTKGVKVIAVCDTNVNPEKIDHVIPANDDSIASLTMITKLIGEAVKNGRAKAKNVAADMAAKAVQAKEEEVRLAEASREAAADLDVKMKEKLAKEEAEMMK
jgi:small subunit ribosomal protein S2